ncbi:MAG: FdhF/YdeP family oxidoreductase, partial [Myxococcota bacterium]
MTERNSKREPASAQPPLEPEPPKLGEPTAVAAGPKAVMISIQHALRQMGAGRSVHALSRVNQTDGFDCMGCAWPDPEQRKAAEFCENGAKAVAEEATTSRVDRRFFSRFSVQELAEHSDHWLGRQGRLTEPMLLRPGSSHYEPIGWTDAFRVIANHLHALETPDEACFYTSGRASNEAAFVYQLFARAFGTNNLPDCSNLCHESSGVALNETIGSGKGTVTLEDFEHADCILMIGQNPGTNHPRMLSTLQDAARRGCAIITVNPLAEAGNTAFRDPQEVAGWAGAGTQFHAQHLRVRINGDVALLKGLAKTVLAEDRARPGEVLDRAFIEAYCDGFDAFVDGIDATEWSHIVASSGVPRDAIERAGRRIARSERVIACWAMGVTQHDNAVANIQEIVNLLLLGGHLGRPGAGACPVRGHSNVQGDRTMGIWERPSEDFLDALAAEFDFAPPRAHGFDAVAAIRAMHDGRARVLIALGGNLLSAASDTEFTADALR